MHSDNYHKDDIIVCENVSAGYGRNVVLSGVSLKIPRGCFLPFIGSNGAGKTTLVKTIIGLLKPLSGNIHTPFGIKPPGYVPQQEKIDTLYPVSVMQIVSMGFYPSLGCWGRYKKEHKDLLEETLLEMNLIDFADRNFSELSSGMKQKALIARAMVSEVECFIMDEPSSQLDERSERELMEHLFTLTSRKNKTIILVHHGFDIISDLIDNVCYFEHGVVSLISKKHFHANKHHTWKKTDFKAREGKSC